MVSFNIYRSNDASLDGGLMAIVNSCYDARVPKLAAWSR